METTTFIGLDVHANQVSIAVAALGRKAPEFMGVVPAGYAAVGKALRRYKPEETEVVYEAGPTGYGLYRYLTGRGYRCAVVAPSLMPVKKGERIKTDTRDAVNLARLSRNGDLTPVWVPGEEDEGYRDLVRCRHDAKSAERIAKQQLNSFFVRHGRSYSEKKWTQKHWQWIRAQQFTYETQRETLSSYMSTVEECQARVEALDSRLEEHMKKWKHHELCTKLMALRGVDRISALTIASEIGDLRRFKTAPAFMSFVGLVPTEHSSGERTKRGSITKAGNKMVRRILVESAWSYRLAPSMSPRWRKRNSEVSQEVRKISWEAQKRLNHKYKKLAARKMLPQKAITGVARELAGFVWSIANA